MSKFIKTILITIGCLLAAPVVIGVLWVVITIAKLELGIKKYDSTPLWQRMGEYGLEVLNEKYPGYEFEILRYDGRYTDTRFLLEEKITGERLNMRVIKEDDDSYRVIDTFWSKFVEDEYAEYCKEKLREKLEEVGSVHIVFSYAGEDCDLNVTVEDITEGSVSVYSGGTIHIAAKGMTEKECEEFLEKVKQAAEEIKMASASYWVEFWDMSVEEMESGETFKGNIYETSIGVNLH